MKEGTGRGAGGSYRATAAFSWEEGAAVPPCFAGCWRKVGAVSLTQARTALARSSERAPQRREPQLNNVGPSRRWLQGNLVGTVFSRHRLMGCSCRGSFHLCCPWAGAQKPIWVGAMLLLCALLQGLEPWAFPSLLSGSLMLIVIPGQGKVAGTQVSEEPCIYLFHKETNSVEGFHIFSP